MYKVLFRDKLLIKSLLSLSTKRVISFVYILFWSQKFSNSYPEAFSLLHSRIHNQKKLKATDCKASLLLATSGGRCITFLLSFFFSPLSRTLKKLSQRLKMRGFCRKAELLTSLATLTVAVRLSLHGDDRWSGGGAALATHSFSFAALTHLLHFYLSGLQRHLVCHLC